MGNITDSPVITPVARLSFPNLFRPRSAEAGKDPKYGCALIFDTEAQNTPEFKRMVEAANAALAEKGWEKGSATRPASLKIPFRKCIENDFHKDHGADAMYINVTSTTRPGIVDENVQPIIDESKIYPGCYVRAEIRAFTYDNQGKGVSFGLNNLQFVKDGEPLGNRRRPEDVFGAVGGGAEGSDAPDNTQSASELL
jgi:hypothetical protein